MKKALLLLSLLLALKFSFTQVKNLYPPISAPANNGSVTYVLDNKIGFIGGFNQGYILKTIDKGENWTPLEVEGAGNIQNFFFINSLEGWATDWINVFKTIDGGTQWKRVSSFQMLIQSLAFANDSIGLLFTTDGRLYRTTNGGNKWQEIETYPNAKLLTLHPVSDKTFLIGNPLRAVAVSYDEGITWQKDPHPITGLGDFEEFKKEIFYKYPCNVATSSKLNTSGNYSLAERNFFNWSKYSYYVNKNLHYNLSQNGELSKYVSGVLAFTNPLSFTQNSVNSFAFFDRNEGIICSRRGVYKTVDGGNNWDKVLDLYDWNGPKTSFYDIFFLDSLTGWATSKGDLYKTTDGGNNWSKRRISNNNLFRIGFFGKGDTGLVTEYPNILYKTYNGGSTWQKDPYYTTKNNFGDIVFNDIHNIWAIGDTGYIYFTNNFGASWHPISLPNDSIAVSSLSFSKNDPEKLWITTYNTFNSILFSTLYYTENGGKTWDKKLSRRLLYNVQFVNDSVGWINGRDFFVGSGFSSFFLRTVDGGKTWLPISRPYTDNARFKFINQKEGIVFDGGYPIPEGFAFYTDDGGYTWESLIPENTVTEISFLGKEHCWFAHGLHQISRWGKAPEKFSLIAPANESTIEVLNDESIIFSWNKLGYIHSYELQFEYKGKTRKYSFLGNNDIDGKLNFETPFQQNQLKLLLDEFEYDGQDYILWNVVAKNTSGETISKSVATYRIRPILIEDDESVNKSSKEPNAFLFPNPAQNTITAKINKQLKLNEPVIVSDIAGKQFKIYPISSCSCSDVQLDVSQLASGMYFIYTDEGTLKFVKQ